MMIDEGLMGALLLSLVYASVSSYIGDPFCIVPLLFLYLLTCARRSRFVTVRGGVGGRSSILLCTEWFHSGGWRGLQGTRERESLKEIGQNDLKARLLCSKRDRKGGREKDEVAEDKVNFIRKKSKIDRMCNKRIRSIVESRHSWEGGRIKGR